MSENQIKYGSSSWTLRLEMPSTWPIESITGVNIAVRSLGGTSLVSSTAATLYAGTTLNGAVTAGATSITMAGTAAALASGDRIRIKTSVAGGAEDCEVDHWDSTNKIAYLKRACYRSHTTGTSVYGMFATYAINVSSATSYPVGTQLIVGWTPSSGGAEITEVYTIAKDEFEGVDTIRRFRIRFPDYYLAAEDRIKDIEAESIKQLRYDFKVRNLDLDRIVDSELTMPSLFAMMAYMITLSGGDQWANERDMLWAHYERETEKLFALPLWVDNDQSQSVDIDDEIQYHTPVVYVRGV